MFFSKQQSSTDLHADVHNSGKLNASAKFLIIERASRYPPVPLIRNSIFARNDPFSHLGSDIIPACVLLGGRTTGHDTVHGRLVCLGSW